MDQPGACKPVAFPGEIWRLYRILRAWAEALAFEPTAQSPIRELVAAAKGRSNDGHGST